MNDAKKTTWETYTRAWQEATREAKAEALAQSASASCLYQDPLIVTKGHRELIDYMMDFHKQLPGGHFVITYFLAHHESSVAKWNLVSGSGQVVGDGVSFGQYDGCGALVAMTGFFEAPSS